MSVEMSGAERTRLKDLTEKRKKEREKGDELSADEECEWEDLSSLRHLEVELMTPTPGCCEASRMHPVVLFSLGYDRAGEAPGEWIAAIHDKLKRAVSTERRFGKHEDGTDGWTFDYGRYEAPPPPKFCPYCGSLLPEMRLKEVIPGGLRDGRDGNYCGTCEQRLSNCLCDPPETAYERIPQSKDYLYALRMTMTSAIADADAELSRVTGARRVAEIWTTLDKLSALAEARLRLALPYVDKPRIAKRLESWLSEAMDAIRRVRPQMSAETIDSANQLVLAFLAIHPEAACELEPMDDDSIAIRWNDAGHLRFIVSRSTLRWPAVSARSYRRLDPASPALECRYARLAEELLAMPYEKASP